MIQTTHVDRERLLVHLTTTIAHSSGESMARCIPCVISPISVTLSLWGHCLPTPAAIAFSLWLAWRAKMLLDAPELLAVNAREVAANGPDPETPGANDVNLEAAPPYRSRKKVRATPRRPRLHRIWSLAAAGEGSREDRPSSSSFARSGDPGSDLANIADADALFRWALRSCLPATNSMMRSGPLSMQPFWQELTRSGQTLSF